MSFITNPMQDPYRGRLVYFVYSGPKKGKTTLLLKLLAEHRGQIAYFLSADKGLKAIQLADEQEFMRLYNGKLAWSYPNSLRELRDDIKFMGDKIRVLAEKKGAGNIWACLDTATAMQINLLTEGRKLAVGAAKKGEKNIDQSDDYVRDMVTEVDYNVNLGLMCEIANALLMLPCNVYITALEKNEYGPNRQKLDVVKPAISGQSGDKLAGDADVIARLVANEDGTRKLLVHPGKGWHAGDRTGKLDAEEPADLWAMHQKILAGRAAEAAAPPPAAPSNGAGAEAAKQ